MNLDYNAISALLQRHNRTLDDYANSYGEPGYSDPEKGILFANWNDVPRYIIEGLERRGFELEWSDEWCTDSEEGKAYRTSANSYGWKPSYILHDGEIISRDSILSNPDWYVTEYLCNDPEHCEIFGVDLSQFGFSLQIEDCETGFHPGQTDDPKKIFAELEDKFDVIFRLKSCGQFDVSWEVWTRLRD